MRQMLFDKSLALLKYKAKLIYFRDDSKKDNPQKGQYNTRGTYETGKPLCFS